MPCFSVTYCPDLADRYLPPPPPDDFLPPEPLDLPAIRFTSFRVWLAYPTTLARCTLFFYNKYSLFFYIDLGCVLWLQYRA